jgi:DNA-binding MarR family transcriptional regulator
MTQSYTESGRLFTDVALETFRLSGALVGEGDRLTFDLGLTSARWKVLGAIDLEQRPLTVSQIARRMGLARQSVQRIVGDLEKMGLVTLRPNPDHQRSPIVQRTAEGEAAYAEVMNRHTEWANRLGAGLDPDELAQALEVLRKIARRMDEEPYAAEQE